MTTNEELLNQATGEEPKQDNSTPKEEETIEKDTVESKMNTDIPQIDSELSDKESEDIALKEQDEGKEFLIESAEILNPQLRDSEGNFVEPKPFSDKKDSKTGYKTKLKIKYKDSNYASFIPNVKWFVNVSNDGSKKLKPWFATKPRVSVEEDSKNQFVAEITKLYFKYCQFVGKEPGKVSQKEFVEGLKGRKVKLKTTPYFYDDKKSTRIDIEEFIN